MKKSFVSLFMTFVLSVVIQANFFAQQNTEKCGSAHLHDQMMQNNSVYSQNMQDFELFVKHYVANNTKTAAQYRIPVVVHVLHKGEAVGVGTNVSDADIRKGIQMLNNNYRKIAGTTGDGNGVDMEIEFALAVRDPNGNCTNGITRVNMSTNSTYMTYGVQRTTTQGLTDDQVKAVTSWDRTKYYNIYLVSEIDNNEGGAGVQGYAYFASSHGQSNDGAVILASNFTSGVSMTTTHELGHSLNLYHTFEGDGTGSTCPSQTNGCGSGAGDCCADTPPHKRSQSDCDATGTNSCNNNSSNSLFVHNYMNYSSDACMNMFTANQKTRALAACSGPRASFFASSNLALVPVSAPVVDFTTSSSVICSGQTVKFMDLSACVPNTYLPETNWSNITFSWTFVNGSTTLTSTAQNPTMTFTVPGAYDVTLTITTSAGTNTLTKNDYVVLVGSPTNACTPTSTYAQTTGQTVSKVVFNTIANTTDALVNAAYTNFVCASNTLVQAGTTYPLAVTGNAGPSGAEKIEVYIDYNNNGTFENGTSYTELVGSGSVAAGSSTAQNTQIITANVTIPSTATTNTILRMRVMGETGTSISAGKRNCTSTFFIGDVEDYGIYIISACTAAPTVGTQPLATAACTGANASISVASTDASSYQWQVSTNNGTSWTNVSNGGVYSTATTSSLTITGATANMSSYQYRCVLTNSCGTTNSSPSVLTVNQAPSLSSSTGANRCGTGTVSLSAAAASGTISWYSAATGGTALGTGTTFTTPSISTTTTYYVSVSANGCSSARTAVVATINPIPTVTNPGNKTVCAGSPLSAINFTGSSSSSSYTWTNTNTAIGLAASGSGNISSFTPSTPGTATIAVTPTLNGCTGTAASFTITVENCAGIEDPELKLVIIYPNPTSGLLTINNIPTNKLKNVALFDAAGRLVLSSNINNPTMNFDLSNAASGNYNLVFTGDSSKLVKRLEIKK